MKKLVCAMLAGLLLAVFAGNALADQKVKLPSSSYSVTIPDGMEYDGPGQKPDNAKFAWVSEPMGLEILFSCEKNARGATLEAMATVLRTENGMDAEIRTIAGIDMIVYRGTDPDDDPATAMKFISYVFLDGNMAQEICFWYANQNAADRTAEIISSISKD